MSDKKIKIFTISDHPLSPSGVGTQTRYMIEAMLKTGKYKFVSFGGAITHPNYQPQTTEEYGEDWTIFPVDGYGTQETVRSILRNERPDILWFMTDPRFYGWLWEIENEIRAVVPTMYYHVWDNLPYPDFNRQYYESNDVVVTISKLTDKVVRQVAPNVDTIHLPHAVNTDIFKKLPQHEVRRFRHEAFPDEKNPDKMIFFWNNRNARRKMSGSVLWWFRDFLDVVGHDNAVLLMHTDPYDVHGQNLVSLINQRGLGGGQVKISSDKYPPENLALLYNLADCTINIADAEGFGLATFESLSCETPIIVSMTGGLQEQVTDGEDWFGIGIEPSSQAVIGSQDVPWIYEDRVSKEDYVNALVKIYEMSPEERSELGRKGRQHVLKNYNYEMFSKRWDEIFTYVHEKYGSWENRKNYQSWRLREIK